MQRTPVCLIYSTQNNVFAPDTTSALKPMDKDVIRNFKGYFRQGLVLNNLIQENGSALDSIPFMKDAYECLVANCFRKSDLPPEEFLFSNHDADDCYLPFSEWLKHNGTDNFKLMKI